MHYKAVLFDFDYTLGDGTAGIVESFNDAFSKMGIPPAGVEPIRRTVGMSLEEAFTDLTGRADEEGTKKFLRLYRARANEVLLAKTELFPDAVRTLESLRSRGCRTGIVTNKYSFRLLEVLDKFEIRQLVDVVVGADLAGASKPDPSGLNMAAGQLGLDKEDILYVGDSHIDAQTAQAAGIDFAAVTTGTTSRVEFGRFPLRYIADDLTNLMRQLEK